MDVLTLRRMLPYRYVAHTYLVIAGKRDVESLLFYSSYFNTRSCPIHLHAVYHSKLLYLMNVLKPRLGLPSVPPFSFRFWNSISRRIGALSRR